MSPGGAAPGFSSMLAPDWAGAAWSRGAAWLLVVALISALQHPVQGSPTVLPDAGVSIGEPWPPEELSSSAASEVLALYGQEEIENTTLVYNTTSASKKVNDTSPTSSIQDSMILQFEELGPAESPMPTPFQPTNPGLNDTSIMPLLTLPPLIPFPTEDGFISSSLPSLSSSSPSSSPSLPPSYQASLSVTHVSSSTTVPYFVAVEEVLTQDAATDVVNSSSYVTSKSVTTNATSSWETTENGTTGKKKQFLETTHATWHTDLALGATSRDSESNNEVESSTVTVTSLTLGASAIHTIHTHPYKSNESNVNSFSTLYKPSAPFNTTFPIPLDTTDARSLEETHTTVESHFNTSTYVPVTQEQSVSSSSEQLSTGLIKSSYYPFTNTTVTLEETSVEATNSSFELSPSPNTMMSTMSVITSTLLNSSPISVQPSDTTNAENIVGTFLSTMMYNTDTNTDDTMSNIKDFLTSSSHSPDVTNVNFSSTQTNSYSELTITLGPSTSRSSTTTEGEFTQRITDDMASRTSTTPSETPSEVSHFFKPFTITYSTDTTIEILETDHTIDTSHVFTKNPNENSSFSSSSMTLSTFENSTLEISTIGSSEVASSVETTKFPISLDTKSDMALWTSDEFVNVTSPLDTNTSMAVYPHSDATLTSEATPENSTFPMINTNTEIRHTEETTRMPTSSQKDSSLTPTESEPITSTLSTLVTTLTSMSHLDVSEWTTQTFSDNSSAMSDITTPPKVNTSSLSQSAVTTGSETFTFSPVSQELYTNNMEANSTPYSSDTATSIVNNSTSFRPTELESSTTFQSSSFSTSNFKGFSTYFNTESEQSTLNIAGVSEVTSPLESSTGSTVITPFNANTLWNITDNTIETATNTLPVTINISKTLVSTNIDTKTEGFEKSTSWDISSPQLLLSSGASTLLLSTVTQPSDYTSSTAQITIVSDNISHGTLFLSSSQSTYSSVLSTVQASATSRNSEYQTNSDLRITANSPSAVNATDYMSPTIQITTVSDNTGHGAVVLSSSQSTNSSIQVTSGISELQTSSDGLRRITSNSPLTQPVASATNYMSSTSQIPTTLDNTSHDTVMLSRSPSSDLSVLSTVQETSKISEYQTSSDALQSTNNSPLTQHISSATNYISSTSEIPTALEITSHGTIMLSSSPSADSSVPATSRSSEYQTSSHSLRSTTANSSLTPPIASATNYMSSTSEITTALDNASHGTIMLSSSPSTDSAAQATSRGSEYKTSSYGLRNTTTNSPSTVTSSPSQPAKQSATSATTTFNMVNSTESTAHRGDITMSTLYTTSHLSSTTIKSSHSSPFSPLTTTIFPTNISDSLSTVSSVVSSAEVSTTGNATQNFTSTEKPSPSSSATLTTPTTHVSPSIIYTLLSTQFTRSTHTPTLGVVTTGTMHFTPTNHTIRTPTTVVFPTTIQTTTFTSAPSTTTHIPSTDIVTTVPETTKASTVLHTITSSTMASTATSPRTTVASVTPTRSATVVNSTALTTILSTSTTPSSFECKLSSETMVKTVLSLMYQPPTTQRETIVQLFEEFLNRTLYRALNQSIQVFVNRTALSVVSQGRNMTVGYSVSVNSSVYIPSAIVDVLTGKNVFNVTELKLLIPILQSVPIVAEIWDPDPDISFWVKTVLKLMGTGANVHTCVYVRNMEQRLQTAYERAELTRTGVSSSDLSVQILSTSKENQILTLIYVVKNNSNALNGTTASSLLNVLSGEVVGYYLGDPPSIIAEPLYYPNIDISVSTMNYWVYTVIQGVDSQLLGPNNQSFARLMEERLATLFQISSQQSRRFRRATTVGSYTVQMVNMQRVDGPNNLAELTYYALKDGQPILGTVAAKQLSTIDPQTMALTLGYIVRIQANSVVQKPPNNLWIIAAVLAPIAVVTVIIIIITAVLCRKNKSDFKSDNMSNLPPRTKPVQGFDYAKQHLGQQGGDEEMLPVTQETVVPSLNLSQERDSTKDGSTEKMLKSSDNRKSRSPCENGSVISNESEEASSDGSTPQKVMAQHRVTKEEACKRNGFPKQKRNKKIVPISDEEEGNIHYDKNKMISDPFDSSSGSVQLIAIKPVSIPPALTVSERNQEMSIINGEVNKALKQKSDIEHYRNKLRLKAKRKGYYDFPPVQSKSLNDRKRKIYDKAQMEIDNVLDARTDTSSPFAEPNRQASMKNPPYRSRQSLNSPSPGETEMDLLVTRERPRRGIRNSGYDTEPEIIEETNIDRVKQARTYIKSRQAKGHSETSTLSSQPSIDEVRQQMHMLLEEAFSLASAGHGGPKRQADPYASAQHLPYSEVVTSAPGTMSRPRMQWVPTYGPEMYQYSLPRPNYRFSQLPEMVIGSPPPPVPPRTGPVAVPSLRRSTSDMANKSRMPEPGGNDQGPGEHVGFPAVSRVPVPVAQTDQSVLNYSGNSMPAVFAIPGNRAGYSGYYIPQPPASYRNQAWMSYSGENDLPGQWADSVPLPGYIEAYPRSRYPQNSPSRLPRQFGQPVNLHPSLDPATGPSIGASQQSLADTDTPDASITNLSTAALVKAIREEVAKLAKKQTDMFEFQV